MNKGTEVKKKKGVGGERGWQKKNQRVLLVRNKKEKGKNLNKHPSTIPTYHSLPTQAVNGKLLPSPIRPSSRHGSAVLPTLSSPRAHSPSSVAQLADSIYRELVSTLITDSTRHPRC